MSLIARNIASRAGNISFEIDAAGTNATFDVISMSTLDYDFDLVTSEDELTYVASIPGAMTITAVDKLSNMGSMFTVIETGIGGYENKIFSNVLYANVNCVLHSRVNPGTTYRFPFTIQYQDVRLDERSGHISLRMNPRSTNYSVSQWGVQRASFLNQATTNIPQRDNPANQTYTGSTTVVAGEFIKDVVAMFYTGPGNSNVYRTATNIGNYTSITFGGQTYTNVKYDAFPLRANIVDLGFGTIVPNFQFDPAKTSDYDNTPAITMVSRLAQMEGAVFGSAFNVNFYINRTVEDPSVTLTNNDIMDLSFEPVTRSINSVYFTYTPGAPLTNIANAVLRPLQNENELYIAWEDAPQQLLLTRSNYAPFLIYGGLESNTQYSVISNSDVFDGTVKRGDYLDPYVSNINKTALRAYGPALGLTQSEAAVYTIELSLIGAEKIRPYHAFQFDTSVPARYQNKMYRPSSISYDFMRDTVSLRAYEIGVATSPEPVTTTAGPTTTSTSTTSTTSTSTTSTTTQGLTEFNTLRQSSVDGPTACTETPGTVTIWANNPVFCNATLFYASNNTGDPFQGNNNYYSDGTCWRQINNSGAIVTQGNCATTTTTSTTSTTSTTTAGPTTTTTTAAPTTTTTSTTTTSTTTTTTSTTTQPPCPEPTLNSISHVSGGTFSVAFTPSGSGNCDGMKVQWSSDNATWSPAFGESMDCTSPNNVDTGLTSGTVYIRIAQQCTTPNEQSAWTASQSYTFPTTTTTTTTTCGGLTTFDNVWISSTSAAVACSGGGAIGPYTIYGNNADFALCTQYYSNQQCTALDGGFDWYADRTSNKYARIASNGQVSNNDQGACP